MNEELYGVARDQMKGRGDLPCSQQRLTVNVDSTIYLPKSFIGDLEQCQMRNENIVKKQNRLLGETTNNYQSILDPIWSK
jgi:hypothetical protein